MCVRLQSDMATMTPVLSFALRILMNTLAMSFPFVSVATGSLRLRDEPAARNTGPLG